MKTQLKTHLALVLGVLLSSLSPALAQLPNGDFEIWPIDSAIPYSDPEDWTSLNEYHYLFGYEEFTVQPSTASFTGDLSLNVQTRKFCNDSPFDYCFLVPGMLVVGEMIVNPADLSMITYGVDYEERPESLSGMFKYLPVLDDSFKITVTLTRRNIEMGTREVVGEAKWISSDSVAQFTPFDMPITYYTAETPDKLKIFIYSGHLNKIYNQPYPVGASLFLDNLRLGDPWNTSTGIGDQEESLTEMTVFPNPAVDAVSIRFTGLSDENYDFEVIDLVGRSVLGHIVSPYAGNSYLELNVSSLAAGSYMVIAKDSNGVIQASQQLILVD